MKRAMAQASAKRFNSTTPANSATPAPATIPSTPIEPAAASTPPPADSLSSMDIFENIHSMPEQIGYLKSLGLDFGWGPTAMVEWVLEHIHVLCQTPWWASIGLTAIAFRILLLKPYMDAADNAAKLAKVTPITKPMQQKMQELSRASDTTGVMAVRRDIQLIHKRAGIKMWKSFVPMTQMFVGYGTFVLIRAMGKLPVPGLETGGILWFQNLALPDPYFILPLATAGILHLVLRKGGETGVNTMGAEAVKLMSIGLPALTVVFTYWLPAGLQFSFFLSGIISAGQSQLFRNAAFRERFGMHPLPTTATADPFAPKVAASKFREDIMTVEQMKAKYEAPQAQGVLEGLKGKVADIKQSANKSMKDMKEFTGQSRTGGKRTKAEIRAAEAYEEKRAKEEKIRMDRLEKEKRRERAARRAERERLGRK